MGASVKESKRKTKNVSFAVIIKKITFKETALCYSNLSIKNQKYKEDHSMLNQDQMNYLKNRVNHTELAEEIIRINDKLYFYLKKKEFLIKKQNFYSELLDEKMLNSALEILPQAFK